MGSEFWAALQAPYALFILHFFRWYRCLRYIHRLHSLHSIMERYSPNYILLLEKHQNTTPICAQLRNGITHCKVLTICSNLLCVSLLSNRHWFRYRGYRHGHCSLASCCSGATGHPGHFPLLLQVSSCALSSMRVVQSLLSTVKRHRCVFYRVQGKTMRLSSSSSLPYENMTEESAFDDPFYETGVSMDALNLSMRDVDSQNTVVLSWPFGSICPVTASPAAFASLPFSPEITDSLWLSASDLC